MILLVIVFCLFFSFIFEVVKIFVWFLILLNNVLIFFNVFDMGSLMIFLLLKCCLFLLVIFLFNVKMM